MNTVKAITLALFAFAFTTSPAIRGESMNSSGAIAPEDLAPATASPTRSNDVSKTTAEPASRAAKASKNTSKNTTKTKNTTGEKSTATANSSPKTSAKTSAKTSPKTPLDLTPTQADKLLALLNQGSSVDLAAISGIAATRAEAIVEARPFRNLQEIILIPGVGDATFERILRHGKMLTQPAAKSAKS